MHQASAFKLKFLSFMMWKMQLTLVTGPLVSARDLFPCLNTILKVHYISMDNTRISERHSSYHSDSRGLPSYHWAWLVQKSIMVKIVRIKIDYRSTKFSTNSGKDWTYYYNSMQIQNGTRPGVQRSKKLTSLRFRECFSIWPTGTCNNLYVLFLLIIIFCCYYSRFYISRD